MRPSMESSNNNEGQGIFTINKTEEQKIRLFPILSYTSRSSFLILIRIYLIGTGGTGSIHVRQANKRRTGDHGIGLYISSAVGIDFLDTSDGILSKVVQG